MASASTSAAALTPFTVGSTVGFAIRPSFVPHSEPSGSELRGSPVVIGTGRPGATELPAQDLYPRVAVVRARAGRALYVTINGSSSCPQVPVTLVATDSHTVVLSTAYRDGVDPAATRAPVSCSADDAATTSRVDLPDQVDLRGRLTVVVDRRTLVLPPA
ncbi:hypothetical protein [Nakamurella endophytica]|uniref:Uncharacterized protein n=1 Tax=Nakamurella endophytica TaxID=1748367 RepID=A0A917SW52_9ACTN|nr:hypothetical protein [Nakamurella endophytica]GGL99233.1 hypothetical protein GCM10011594_19020 [Nakamurella endophytica]